jgi:hypothetical protein
VETAGLADIEAAVMQVAAEVAAVAQRLPLHADMLMPGPAAAAG